MVTTRYIILLLCFLLTILTIAKRLIAIKELNKRIDEVRAEEKREQTRQSERRRD